MKRKPFDPNAPRPIRSWFRWHECCACKLEFRREPGWRRTGHPLRLGLYACSACAPTEAEAHELFEQRWPGPGQPRPRAPQAPPMRNPGPPAPPPMRNEYGEQLPPLAVDAEMLERIERAARRAR